MREPLVAAAARDVGNQGLTQTSFLMNGGQVFFAMAIYSPDVCLYSLGLHQKTSAATIYDGCRARLTVNRLAVSLSPHKSTTIPDCVTVILLCTGVFSSCFFVNK